MGLRLKRLHPESSKAAFIEAAEAQRLAHYSLLAKLPL